jgi:hypothetical protein
MPIPGICHDGRSVAYENMVSKLGYQEVLRVFAAVKWMRLRVPSRGTRIQALVEQVL